MTQIITETDGTKISIEHCEDRRGRCYWDDYEERGHCECSCPGCDPE